VWAEIFYACAMECADRDRLNKQAREAIRERRKHCEVNRAATVRLDAAVNEEKRSKLAWVPSPCAELIALWLTRIFTSMRGQTIRTWRTCYDGVPAPSLR
jgi:hypothetical protein